MASSFLKAILGRINRGLLHYVLVMTISLYDNSNLIEVLLIFHDTSTIHLSCIVPWQLEAFCEQSIISHDFLKRVPKLVNDFLLKADKCIFFPNSWSLRTVDEESVAITMNKNKNICDLILSKMITRGLMMLIFCIVSRRIAEFYILHVQTPSDESSFVCFLCAMHLCQYNCLCWISNIVADVLKKSLITLTRPNIDKDCHSCIQQWNKTSRLDDWCIQCAQWTLESTAGRENRFNRCIEDLTEVKFTNEVKLLRKYGNHIIYM